jgi:hopanoid biosynthesis associated RND transporter like protein HpnN
MRLLRQSGQRLLKYWIDLVQRTRIAVVIILPLLAVLALFYAMDNLGMNMETKDMLSPKLPWRHLDREYDRQFPQYTDNILVVVQADTPDQATDAANALYDKLKKETGLFKSIYYPNALPVFRDSSLLFLDTKQLQDLADNLARIQPFLSRLTDDQTLRGLFGMLTEAVDAKEKGEDIDIDPLLKQIHTALVSLKNKQPYRVSWQRLMNGAEKEKKVYRQFIVTRPILHYDKLFPAAPAVNKIRELTSDPGVRDIGASVHLTGSAMLAHEELESVMRGTELTISLALIAVTVIMFVGLGSFRLVVSSLITLIVGLIFTAAFAAWAIGRLNLISVAFAVLYIGLGVDFAIHYCLRFRELVFEGLNKHDAIDETSLNMGSSLFLCAITTAIGFFAFIPTSYNGVAELGLISGVGMFISLAVTLTLLPALLSLIPVKFSMHYQPVGMPLSDRIGNFPITHARGVKIVSFILLLIFVALSTHIRFDYNTLNLQNPNDESIKTMHSLMADTNTPPWPGIILAKDRKDAEATIAKMKKLPVVDKVMWLDDFIPDNQDKKLAIIEDMNLMLIGLPEPGAAKKSITTDQQLRAIRDFTERLGRSPLLAKNPVMKELHQSLSGYLGRLGTMNGAGRAAALNHLSRSLLASLPGRLETLRRSLSAHRITRDNLSEDLVRRWVSPSGQYLLQIYPAQNIFQNKAMRRFVKQIRSVDKRVIGDPVIDVEASDTVVSAFTQAFTFSVVIITLFLLLVLKHKRDVGYILAPMFMAAIFTAGMTVLLDMPFNFANIIALPLLLGIGVDSGIHILHRVRTSMPEHNNILATSSARAIIVSAATTIGGIGNLAFSHHLGTASLGKLLSIGIAITLICMLIILPSLLASHIKGRKLDDADT